MLKWTTFDNIHHAMVKKSGPKIIKKGAKTIQNEVPGAKKTRSKKRSKIGGVQARQKSAPEGLRGGTLRGHGVVAKIAA